MPASLTPTPGTIVTCRQRQWVILPSENEEIIRLRPLSGSENQICGIYRPLGIETIESAQFPLPLPEDEEFYDRLFTSIFLYFSQYQPLNPHWYAIVIYERRSRESTFPPRYQALVEPHLRRIYLDELAETTTPSLGVGIIKLVVESNQKASELAKQLIIQAKEQLTDTLIQEKVLEFIETIIVYKFPKLSPEEIETMLNLNIIKDTQVYQTAKEEGKLETVPKLIKKGLSIQEIAEVLELDIETVRKATNQV